jgi:hypothetical protein
MRLEGVSGGGNNLRRRRIVSHPSIPIGRSLGIFSKITITIESHDADCFSMARRNRQNLALVYFPVRRPNIFDPRERVEKSWVELRHPVVLLNINATSKARST